jgi:hypothetical protein
VWSLLFEKCTGEGKRRQPSCRAKKEMREEKAMSTTTALEKRNTREPNNKYDEQQRLTTPQIHCDDHDAVSNAAKK